MHLHGRSSLPNSGSDDSYETDGELCRMLGTFSDGAWKVGRTVSRQILHCLGGQCLSGLGARWGLGEVLLCLGCGGAFSSKAPGTERCLGTSVEADGAGGMSCGQFHPGFGLKPVEVMVVFGEMSRNVEQLLAYPASIESSLFVPPAPLSK